MAVDVEKKSTSEMFRGESLKCLLVASICAVRKRTVSKRKTLLSIHCAALLSYGAKGLGLCWRKMTVSYFWKDVDSWGFVITTKTGSYAVHG